MQLKTSTIRRFNQVLSKLTDDQVELLLNNFKIDVNKDINQRLNQIHPINKSDVTLSEFNKLWKTIELCNLFTSFLSPNKIKITNYKLSGIKRQIKSKVKGNTKITVFEIYKKPRIIFIAANYQNNNSAVNRASNDRNFRDTIYIIPELKIGLSDITDDDAGKDFKEIITKLVGELSPLRVISMNISKTYNENKIIQKLSVNAMFQITGFAGFNKIIFEGDHVKQGLYGLHKRQDIRVHLDQIGPNIEVETENLYLKIGPRLKIKNFSGLKKIINLLF